MNSNQFPQTRIIILNYNGAELLPQCLPSIMQAARQTNFTQVTVLDNCSTDEGLSYVSKNFHDCCIERTTSNRLLCSYNDYLLKIKEPVIILLNNDMCVDRNFVMPLVEYFMKDPLAFLAAPKVMTFDGKTVESGRSKARMRFGIFECTAHYSGYVEEILKPSETFSAGFGAFSRDKFNRLEGYDELYLPGIMEDVDLCYRAQKLGYHLYYEPQSIVYHIGQVSFKKRFGTYQTAVLAHRNNFWFMWKNFSGSKFWIEHLFFLPLRLMFAVLRGNWAFVKGFFGALTTKKTSASGEIKTAERKVLVC